MIREMQSQRLSDTGAAAYAIFFLPDIMKIRIQEAIIIPNTIKNLWFLGSG